jgi:predicted nucleotidyltransferase
LRGRQLTVPAQEPVFWPPGAGGDVGKALLIGSDATGESDNSSDVDMLVSCEEFPPPSIVLKRWRSVVAAVLTGVLGGT